MDEEVWGVDAGIYTDYDGVIVDAFFQLNTESQFAAQTQLRIKFATTDDKVHEERYNCGPDWVSNDGGETVTHPAGKKRFNQNTQAGKFVKALIDIGAAPELGGAPTTAKTYLGCRLFMEAVTSSGKNRDTGEEWSSTKNYPTKFLGVEAVGVEGGHGESSAPSATGWESLSDATQTQVKALAKSLTYAEWIDRVLELDGVASNPDVVVAFSDEGGIYQELKNG